MESVKEKLLNSSSSVDQTLDVLLKLDERPERRIIEAMRYSCLGGGKRIRPFLILESSSLFGVDVQAALRVAAAIEMVHCYSLIHDDLPAMDNDDLRRGKATCHKQFDEATAILAGDALLTKAFEVLSEKSTDASGEIRSELVLALARASGHKGMVGGQMIDLLSERKPLELEEISYLQRLKTGALIECAVESGAILGRAPEFEKRKLGAYAFEVGLAFQITDDLLDVEGEEAQVGKKTGKDKDAGKATFVSILGVEEARNQAIFHCQKAIEELEGFGARASILRDLAKFIVTRSS